MTTIFTVFILKEILGAVGVVYNSEWNYNNNNNKQQTIITKEGFLTNSFEIETYNFFDDIINFYFFRKKWFRKGHMSLCDFKKLKKRVSSFLFRTGGGKRILLHLRGRPIIHFSQVYNWEINKVCKKNTFNNIIKKSQDMFYVGKERKLLKNTFAIHIRRGDCGKLNIKRGLTCGYYHQIINIINDVYKNSNLIPNIQIYSENRVPKDIRKLNKKKNTYLNLGSDKSANQDFYKMCQSEFIIPAMSIFSVQAMYFGLGFALLDTNIYKKTKCFYFMNPPPCFIKYYKLTTLSNTIRQCIWD
ncbi:MAG: hypothetical protein ACOC56_05530 [Atribacterota bacterium]